MGLLKDKVIKGVLWNGTERFGTSFFLFISNLILARLLSPDDFGCVGMLLIFISVSDAIVDGGFGAALIQKKNVTQEDYSTIFFWNLIVSSLLYGLLFLFAPVIASFYKIELLSDILRIQGVVLFFHGFCIIQRCILHKQLLFNKLAKINLTSTFSGTVAGIICALLGFGVWSLVVKSLFAAIVGCFVLWFISTWRPIYTFSKESFRSLFKFGSFMFLTNITNSLYQNAVSLIIGKTHSSATLGYFTQARKLEDIPRSVFSAVIGSVTFPAFSSLQDNKPEMISAFKKTLDVLSIINFSLLILLMVISRPLIIFLLTEKWIQCVPYFQLLCIYGLFMSIMELNQGLLKALGKTSILFYTGIVRRTLAIVLILIGTLWGMKGILFGFVLEQYISFVIVACALNTVVDYSIVKQMKDLLPPLAVSVVSGIVVVLLFYFIPSLTNIVTIISKTIIFVLVLIFLSMIFKIRGFCYLKEIVLNHHTQYML